ncbi:MAG: transglycosylase SLT domain-containing protein [Gammaproteobacteria bacterium]|nr:transglycosylase SLT domain-containing protein [Gammaproteobacteria bacterium]
MPFVQKRTVAALLAAAAMPLASHADIYKYVDKRGQVHLADRPLHSGFRVIVRTWKGWEHRDGAAPGFEQGSKAKYNALIDRLAKRYNMDTLLIHAVVRAESSYNPNAISKAGAVGLMQLMPETAKRFGVRNRRDPADNLRGGIIYLRHLMLIFDDLKLALAAYNAGEGAVMRHGKRIPPYKETQTYVRRVLRFYQQGRAQQS